MGARPNFVKMAPLLAALERRPNVSSVLVHTGQHYDANMSDVFFDELGMRPPDVCLESGPETHGEQTTQIYRKMEQVLERGAPDGAPFDRVIVVGDVNSTLAAALAAAKLGIPVAHVEAGLRSFDRAMPEEINRIVIDAVADVLFVSEPSGIENLRREGRSLEDIHLVGNVMIDTLISLTDKALQRDCLDDLALVPGDFGVVTLHRPANVDDRRMLERAIDMLIDSSGKLKLVMPLHPRTHDRLHRFGLMKRLNAADAIVVSAPLGYLDFLALIAQAKVIITDSGGVQEESTALGVPCLTLRASTERPITVEQGTNTLVGADPTMLATHLHEVLAGKYKQGRRPELWDGRAAERIADALLATDLAHQPNTGVAA